MEKGIEPQNQYNIDEIGFRIGIGKNQWIVTRELDRAKLMTIGSSTNRDLITVCETISPDGCGKRSRS